MVVYWLILTDMKPSRELSATAACVDAAVNQRCLSPLGLKMIGADESLKILQLICAKFQWFTLYGGPAFKNANFNWGMYSATNDMYMSMSLDGQHTVFLALHEINYNCTKSHRYSLGQPQTWKVRNPALYSSNIKSVSQKENEEKKEHQNKPARPDGSDGCVIDFHVWQQNKKSTGAYWGFNWWSLITVKTPNSLRGAFKCSYRAANCSNNYSELYIWTWTSFCWMGREVPQGFAPWCFMLWGNKAKINVLSPRFKSWQRCILAQPVQQTELAVSAGRNTASHVLVTVWLPVVDQDTCFEGMGQSA